MWKIRKYQSTDLEALYNICLLTGDSGQDASTQYTDPKLLGHFFAAPYAHFEPNLVFLLTDEIGVCGYVLGTSNSTLFANFINQVWLPPLQKQYPLSTNTNKEFKDAWLIKLLHRGYILPEHAKEYPAHLHIDLLPRAQGQGMGKKLMQVFIEQLQVLGVPGLHLGVGAGNTTAIGFYEHFGFRLLSDETWRRFYGFGLK